MSDNRTDQRRKVLKGAIASFNQGHSTLSCLVRDLSETGCRISAEGAVSIPDTFSLFVELDGLSAECEVTWRDGSEAGVRFTSAPCYDTPKRAQIVQPSVPEKPARLRREGARIVPASPAGAPE
jgi:hypothetical protein